MHCTIKASHRETHLSAALLLVWCLFSSAFVCAQVDSVRLTPGQDTYTIDRGLVEVLVDSNGVLYPEDALHRGGWVSLEESLSSLPEKPVVHWMKLRVHNLEGSSFEEYKISVAFTDLVALYSLNSNGFFSEQISGDLVPLDLRPVDNGRLVFLPFSAPHKGGRTILLRLESSTDISWQFRPQALRSLKIYTAEGFERRFNTPRFYQAFFYGAILIMVFYNLFIFISLRSYEYLLYVAYLIALTLFFLSNGGYLMELLLPDSPRTDLYIRFLSTPLVMVTYIGFSMGFLNTRSQAPTSHKVLFGLIFLYVVDTLIMGGISWKLGRTIAILLALISYLFILVISIREVKSGYTPARYFLAANFLLILGAIIYAVPRVIGVVQNPLTQYGVQLGVVLEVSLLSIGLADRINVAKKEASAQILERERLEKQQEKERKEFIESQNKELEAKVKRRTQKVIEQKESIEKFNKSLTDSIQYARRIQQAILGEEAQLLKLFPESFILLLSKDIVSGDFFWVGEAQGKQLVIAADCTGHGVPGAFMTVMGQSLLNEIINEMHIWQPDEVLRVLDEKIRSNLHTDDGGSNDGMDISVIAVDKGQGTLWFSGAKNPLCHFSDGKMTRIKGSSSSVGGKMGKRGHHYELHEIQYREGDSCFIFSDGFQDQFGGPEGRKFLSTNFRKMLAANAELGMQEQKALLERAFYEWKGEHKQTDDVLIIGLKLST